MLLHETANGLFLQTIPGGERINEQRTAWLNESPLFYWLALFLFAVALLIVLSALFKRNKLIPKITSTSKNMPKKGKRTK